MIKCALFLACLAQGPGLPPGSPNLYDVEPIMTASLSPGGITQKKGTTKYTTITTTDLDQYKVWSLAENKEIVISVAKVPVINPSLQSTTPGPGTLAVTSSTTAAGVTVRTHANVLTTDPGSLSQIIVTDTFNIIDMDTDTLARDGAVQLGQIVTITKD